MLAAISISCDLVLKDKIPMAICSLSYVLIELKKYYLLSVRNGTECHNSTSNCLPQRNKGALKPVFSRM